MTLYKNKYRIETIRHPGWNYSDDGMYFVTICTKDKKKYFGKIINEKICLSSIGKIANEFWLKIPKHFDNVILDEYIIMPNHLHGIIFICNDDAKMPRDDNNINNAVETRHGASNNNTETVKTRNGDNTETRHGASLRKFGALQKNSLSSVINHYKGTVKRHCNKQNINFAWQPRFYDKIIHNEYSLQNIRNYIYYNYAK